MPLSRVRRSPVENRVLLALPTEEYHRLLPHLEHVPLAVGKVLYEPGDMIRYVYFPNSGVASLSLVSNGMTIEIGMVGKDGMLGLPVCLGVPTSQVRVRVRGAGTAMRMKARWLTKYLEQSGALRQLLHQYTCGLLTQIAESAACNQCHTVEARLARWLLMTQDRMPSDKLKTTQQLIGQLMGVRRSSVSHAASAFQKRKLIHYSRGTITVLNRHGLEDASCQSYRAISPESSSIGR